MYSYSYKRMCQYLNINTTSSHSQIALRITFTVKLCCIITAVEPAALYS